MIARLGWRSGFLAPGLLSVVVALIMYRYLKDRPEVYGLPRPEVMFDQEGEGKRKRSVRFRDQLYVLRSPTVWIIALACAMMYVSRYAINSWAILFLQEAKGYSLIEAGAAMSFYPIAGLIGAVASGWLSDGLFGGHRPLSSTVYALANIGGMALLFWGPNTQLNDAVALTIFGFGIGGLIVFLAGLIAAELMPKEVVGAVKGFIGLFAYLGAAAQEYLSSVFIKVEELNGHKTYDFEQAIYFWFGAGVLSMLLTLLIWNQRPVSLQGE